MDVVIHDAEVTDRDSNAVVMLSGINSIDCN